MTRDVTVGDRTYRIQSFRGFKAARVGRIIARVSEQGPVILNAMAEFTKEYEANNTVRITRAMARTPRFEPLGLTDEDFAGREYVEIPSPPTAEERILAVFPKIFELAEREVVELLALIVAPNSELREADDESCVDEYLREKGRELLHEGELQELAELVIVAQEVLREQFAGKTERLRLLMGTLEGARQQRQASRQTEEPNVPANPPVDSMDQNTTSQPSSTDSHQPTDGTAEQSSLGLSGVS